MKTAFFCLLFLFFKLNIYSQEVKLPIDSLTNKVIFNHNFSTSNPYVMDMTKKWISQTYNIPLYEVKEKNQSINFIAYMPIYNLIHAQQTQVGEVIYKVSFYKNSKEYVLSMTDFLFLSKKTIDSLSIENLIKNNTKLLEINSNEISKQILDNINDLINGFQLFLNNKALSNTILKTSSLNNPGDELILSANHMYLGLGLVISGSLVASLGSSISINSGDSGGIILIIAGAITSVVGIVFSIESFSHIKKAGIMFNLQQSKMTSLNIKQTKNGIGLVYNF